MGNIMESMAVSYSREIIVVTSRGPEGATCKLTCHGSVLEKLVKQQSKQSILNVLKPTLPDHHGYNTFACTLDEPEMLEVYRLELQEALRCKYWNFKQRNRWVMRGEEGETVFAEDRWAKGGEY